MPRDLSLWEPLLEAPFFQELERRVRDADTGLWLSGLVEDSRALVLALLAARSGRPMLVVVPDDAALESYRRDLSAFGGLLGGTNLNTIVMPALDSDPYDAIAPHPEVVRERVAALTELRHGKFDIVLTPARALLSLVPAPDAWDAWTRVVRVGDTVPPDQFVPQAMGLGYRRVDTVSGPGEISRRGGIVDLFPMNAGEPVRIELFGDSVESLRTFHTDNQRSTGKLDQLVFGPASESPPTEEALRRVEVFLRAGVTAATGDDRRVRHFRELLDVLENQGVWPSFESLAGITAERPVTLFEHLPDTLIVLDEPERAVEELARAASDLVSSYENSPNKVLPAPGKLFANAIEVRERLSRADLRLQELIPPMAADGGAHIAIACRSARAYAGRVAELIDDQRKGRDECLRTVCVMRAEGSAARLVEIFDEYDLTARRADRRASTKEPVAGTPGGLFVAVGALRAGFELPVLGLTVLSEQGIFGEQRKPADRKSKSRAAFISDFRDLKNGDLVVHVDHGLARYGGLGRPKGGSLNRDFMILEFSGGDKLFVPIDRLDLVQKYSGVAGHTPRPDKLGGPGWEKVKSRVRKSVRNMAKELLELYARRKAATGHAFGPDTPWQAELEAAFPYELTPDQVRTTADIKEDMESDRPMDRLLVGDVGFGKTEVAVRAAFKAVMDGRQVAVLSPTTVLAMQHFQTFAARYAPFPLRVEMISRFRSAGDIRKVLQDVAVGTVDVLIGTHRILSKDIEFKRLGLLVVDEEQRFGVTHKERLKSLSIGVDVLSMTATPIPRTLQMSMAGVRDLSIIETPPPGRMAIQTYLVPFRTNVLAQAIRQELRREGQVYVVHNKVETLPSIARAVREMAPEARIAMVHGQMSEKMLEKGMLAFVNREADVLVTTTIIENGLDIPRANTIIVNRADRFGLAQLYQLRGRVGRSAEHAYAYFVVPSRSHLSTVALRRLRALQEFSELGSGFRLAAADLEIRGAGELLGSRQHGHIGALGFDLYCQMLERAVAELNGEDVAERLPVSLNLAIDIKVPQNYLPEASDRLVLYKRLAQAHAIEDIDRLRAETEDRFGHLPLPVQNLFAMAGLRSVAVSAGVKSVDLADDRLQIRFHDRPFVEPARLVQLVAQEGGSLSPSGMLVLPAPPRDADRIASVGDTLARMLEACPDEVH